MHVFKVAAKIAALGESFLAHGTCKGTLASVLAEMVPKVATLLEYALAACMLALEVQFDALGFEVLDLDSLVPLARDS